MEKPEENSVENISDFTFAKSKFKEVKDLVASKFGCHYRKGDDIDIKGGIYFYTLGGSNTITIRDCTSRMNYELELILDEEKEVFYLKYQNGDVTDDPRILPEDAINILFKIERVINSHGKFGINVTQKRIQGYIRSMFTGTDSDDNDDNLNIFKVLKKKFYK